MATLDRPLAKANTTVPQYQASSNGEVKSGQDIGPVEPTDESWVWNAYGVKSLDDLKLKYGLDELQGVSAEEAARVWEDIRVNGTISLEDVKRELGFD